MKEKKYIAITGFAKPHCKDTPWDDPNAEIWSLNEGHVYMENDDRTVVKEEDRWLKRADRWFQIHASWDFRRVNHPVPHHLPWLQELPKDGMPVMMQDEFPDIEASMRYPFDEIVDLFCTHLIRRLKTGEEERNLYFTSSLAYMIVYAIYLIETNPDTYQRRIELYGTDMEASTEYIHQKGSMEYWIGFANGRGIKVILPQDSFVANAPLYAYEVAQVVPLEVFQKRLKLVEEMFEKFDKDRQEVVKKRGIIENTPGITDKERAKALEEEMYIVGVCNKVDGRRRIIKEIIEHIEMQRPFSDADIATENGIMRSTVEILKKIVMESENKVNINRLKVKGIREYAGARFRAAIEAKQPRNIKHWKMESIGLLREDMDLTNRVNNLRGQMFELHELSQYIDYREVKYLREVNQPEMMEDELDG